MSSSDQNTAPETRDEPTGRWWQVLPFAVFGISALLLLVGGVIQSFWPEAMAGHSSGTGLIILSVCATALIGGLAVMMRHHLTTGIGMVLIALIPIIWVVFGQTAIGPTGASGGETASVQCRGAPWVTGRRNFAINRMDEASDFMVSVPSANMSYHRFRVTEATVVRLEAVNGDPALSLTDAAGLELMANDDIDGTQSAQIVTDLAEGTYCVGVRNVGTPTPYRVRIGLEAHEPLIKTPFHTCKAEDLASLQTGGTADLRVDEDGYKALRVTVEDGIVLEGNSSAADPRLAVYSFDGRQLAADDDGGSLTNALLSLSPSDLEDGDYCLVVDTVTGSGVVSVQASTYDREMMIARQIASGERTPDENSDLVEHLGLIDGAFTKNVQVAGEDENEGVRWYLFDLAKNGLVVIDLQEGPIGDPKLALYTVYGREIAQDDDSGNGRDARISVPLSVGSYLISAGSYNKAPLEGQLDIQIYEAQ